MKDNIELASSGYFTILPVCDGEGRSIIYMNRSVVDKVVATTSEVRFGVWSNGLRFVFGEECVLTPLDRNCRCSDIWCTSRFTVRLRKSAAWSC